MNGVRLADVSDVHLGVWIEGSSVRNPYEFNIAIVELGLANGFEINMQAWENDKPMFLNGHATFDMVEDLGFLVDTVLDFLNAEIPAEFYFDFEDGLCLFRVEDDD